MLFIYISVSLISASLVRLMSADACTCKSFLTLLPFVSCRCRKLPSMLCTTDVAVDDAVSEPFSRFERLAVYMYRIFASYSVGIWCQNGVVTTSMRRHHVASTLIRRNFYVMCPLGKGTKSTLFLTSVRNKMDLVPLALRILIG